MSHFSEAGGLVNDTPIRGEDLTKPIYWLGRQWAVTGHGVEARDGTYAIENDRLREVGWLSHMAEKNWVDMDDFADAYAVALSRHARRRKRSKPR